jgi:hypothetical protein
VREYRIITDGRRYRAQMKAPRIPDIWCDLNEATRFRWLARVQIWRHRRQMKYADACEARRRADEHAIWERIE